MRNTIRILLMALMLPMTAQAADVTLSLDGDVLYDSNVFRRENDIKDDVLFRIRPGIELHEDRGQDVNYSLGYIIPIQLSTQYGSRLNDIDQIADGEIRYHVNDRMDVFASDNFRYLRTTVQQAELNPTSGAGVAGSPNLSTRRDRVTLNFAELGANYRFAPRLTGNLLGSHRYFDTDLRGRQENWFATGAADLEYTLSSKHVLGLGVRYIHGKFYASEDFVGSKSNTINGFASWRYQITETTSFSINAGPSYISVDQDNPPNTISASEAVPVFEVTTDGAVLDFTSCPETFPGSGERYIPSVGCGQAVALDGTQRTNVDNRNSALGMPFTITNTDLAGLSTSDLTVFGEAALSQRWTPNLASALRYERTQGTASGLGGTVTVDAASFATTWDFAERWQLALRGDWTWRKSVAEVNQIFNLAQGFNVGGTNPFFAAEYTGVSITSAPSRNRVETMRWGVAGRITHQLWRNTKLYGQLAYNEQDSNSDTLGGFSDFRGYMAFLGIRHDFEPLKVW